MNINNLNYKNNPNYKDNLNYDNKLNYKDSLKSNNSNSILSSKSIILNSKSLILNFSKSAFSLIELSIVLIIIGLLIAGVTGGASLIQSAKVRQMMNELKDYERAVYTFQAARGRYPGDVKNYGTFGWYSNYNGFTGSVKPYYAYQATDFPSDFLTEFQKTAGSGVLPNYDSAPFVELYNEGIIDFRPLGNVATADKSDTKKGVPSLKVEPNAYVYFYHLVGSKGGNITAKPCEKGKEDCYYSVGALYSSHIKEILVSEFKGGTATNGFNPKLLNGIDEKMDDGWFNTGVFRSGCYGSNSYGENSYDNSIKNSKKCSHFDYIL